MNNSELDSYIYDLQTQYKGDLVDLANAMGALNLGRVYGNKVLRIIYSPHTYRKYQKVLGVKFSDVLPDVTDYSKKSAGYQLVKRASDFWNLVNRTVEVAKGVRTKTVVE
jgi:hypothetical protein